MISWLRKDVSPVPSPLEPSCYLLASGSLGNHRSGLVTSRRSRSRLEGRCVLWPLCRVAGLIWDRRLLWATLLMWQTEDHLKRLYALVSKRINMKRGVWHGSRPHSTSEGNANYRRTSARWFIPLTRELQTSSHSCTPNLIFDYNYQPFLFPQTIISSPEHPWQEIAILGNCKQKKTSQRWWITEQLDRHNFLLKSITTLKRHLHFLKTKLRQWFTMTLIHRRSSQMRSKPVWKSVEH